MVKLRSVVLPACAMALALATFAGTARADDEALMKQIREKWNATVLEVKDITIEQEMKIVTPQGERVMGSIVQRKGEKSRVETDMGGMKMTMINDGTDVWMITPMGARKMPNRQKTPDAADLPKLPDDAKIVRSETVGDRDCQVVQYTRPKETSPTLLWIDPKDLAIAKTEMKQGDKTVTGLFSDFKPVYKDLVMGHKMEISMDGKPMGTITIKSIKVNTGLADDLFTVKADTPPAAPAPTPG
jgi:outer membrane lipoprotein-sorting protein